jgi:hypothetical protein
MPLWKIRGWNATAGTVVTAMLQSPFAIWICLLIAVTWLLTLLAIFWPGLGNTKADLRKQDDSHGCL